MAVTSRFDMAFDMEKLIKYVSALSVLSFLAGGFWGIYSRWQHHSSDKSFIIFGTVAVAFFLLSSLLYFFDYKEIARSITNFWIGLIFSVLTFTSIAYDHLFVSAQDLDIVDMLLIGSTFIHCLGILLERVHNYGNIEFKLLASREIFLLVGFAFGSQVFEHITPTLLLLVAVACNLIAVHLKSALSLVNAFMTSILVALEFFPAIKVQYNPFCLTTFAIWLSFEPIIDMYFSKYSTVDRWKGFLTCGKWKRKFFVLLIFIGECVYVACAAQVTISHNRAVVIAPIFSVFLLFWLAGHVVFFVDCWGFLIKLDECSLSLKEDFDTNTMLDILASRGVRHFCLISKSIVLLSVATTILLAIPSWQVTNAWFISSFLIVMPIESMVYSVLSSLGKCLGGTAIGYAVILPYCDYSKDGMVAIIPETMFQVMNRTAIELIGIISRFFTEHIIHNFGTELCTSGLTIQSLESKLRPFFAQRVPPEVPYDSYVLYFSGPVHDNGDWALLENNAFSLAQLLSLWEEVNGETGSRLILTLDTKNSYKWLPEVKKLNKFFVGVQVGELQEDGDVEAPNVQSVGELTNLWVNFNSSSEDSKEKMDVTSGDVKVRLQYGVSRNWCDFRFHVPTQKDISHHIEESFPTVVQPIMRFCNKFPHRADLFCPCEGCVSFVRKMKMRWLPPLTLDTGHGFKLIRTINKI